MPSPRHHHRRALLARLAAGWALGIAVGARRAVAQAPLASFGTDATRAASRVGHVFWLRPGLADTSVDVFDDAGLRQRRGLRGKHRVRIEAVERGGPWPGEDAIYRLRLVDDTRPAGGDAPGRTARSAWMAVAEFERCLFVEPAPNAVPISPLFTPPLGVGIHVWQFDRASVFSEDPDMIEPRVRPQGPRSFEPGPRAAPPERPAPRIDRTDPTAPVIAPR
jgi:hypothetical protein